MMNESDLDLQALKQNLRRQALDLRREQPAKDELSRLICEKFAALKQYCAAAVVMAYVGIRSEVRTRPFLLRALEQGKTLVVPYCVGQELGLFRLESLDELAEGYFGLWEPRPELRSRPDKQMEPSQLDLIMVPGVAFDRQGGRIGHGKGYYDRLLSRVRADACLVGVAFACQLVPAVPVQPYDVPMDLVITEQSIEQGRGRRQRPSHDA
jgi:5-formyltetrahydrofolate cyclo-ligase